MKFRLSFKSPDVLDQIDDLGLNEDDMAQCMKTAQMWLKWNEYIAVEFDTVEITAIVVK